MMTITNNILTDIDECAQDTHNCSKENALCHNSEGTFNCTCKPGLTEDLIVIKSNVVDANVGWQHKS